ncbi:MAG TPA: DNA polymerase IV [Candidatus Avanaerovorax faecigallinarum]|nr:DNA polymerase IV [Candidatus Avanaerovorax faecigallinarum]
MDRIILHCDMNSFFASVELIEHPELKEKPVAVCGDPDSRHGIILAKNEPAKAFGIVTAETVSQARRKCPDLILLPPHHDKYRHYSRLINAVYYQYTDMVEPFSIDESWLDVTASVKLFGSGRDIADRIRERVRSELGLTLSAGVSYNKIFAKMGSEYKKPDATTEITRENYKRLLWPQPVENMFFVGFATAQKLRSAGISTIGDLASASDIRLESLLGKQGPLLIKYASGRDDSPVSLSGERDRIKSVGNGITFSRDLKSAEDALTAVTSLSDTVAGRLRKYGFKAKGVKVDIKDASFKSISRQKQLVKPTHLSSDIKQAAMELISSSWRFPDPIRLITVTAINLTDGEEGEQLSFFGNGYSSGCESAAAAEEKSDSIEKAMDDIRRKFGDSSITFGQLLNNDIGIDF